MTSGLPESVCLSSIRETQPVQIFEGGPLKNQKPLLQKCIFQHEDLTINLQWYKFMTLYIFFRKFVNLLRLEGKAHHFCLKGLIKNM